MYRGHAVVAPTERKRIDALALTMQGAVRFTASMADINSYLESYKHLNRRDHVTSRFPSKSAGNPPTASCSSTAILSAR